MRRMFSAPRLRSWSHHLLRVRTSALALRVPHFLSSQSVKTPEERLALLRKQVDAKVQWGARRAEVAEWLPEKHGIEGEEAGALLDHAFRARRNSARERALFFILLSVIGLTLVTLFAIRFALGDELGEHFATGTMIETPFAVALAWFSLSALFRSLRQLLRKDESDPAGKS